MLGHLVEEGAGPGVDVARGLVAGVGVEGPPHRGRRHGRGDRLGPRRHEQGVGDERVDVLRGLVG